MSAPYIVRFTGPGEADVVDRKTGERVGWVRADFWGRWWGFSLGVAGGTVAHERYRGEAAGAVWQATRGAK